MDFSLPPETQGKCDAARRFAAEALARRGYVAGFDREAWRAAAKFGAFHSAMRQTGCAKRHAGALDSVGLFEALGRGGASRGLLFAMGAHLFGCLAPFATYATGEQLAVWELQLRDGSAVATLAVTEAGGGSSLDHIRCTAEPAPGGFLLSGEKTLIANASVADLLIVLARHAGEHSALGLSAFLVPARSEGVVVRRLATPGLAGAAAGGLSLNRCFVPAAAILGREGAGLRVFATALRWERSCLLAGFLGAAERDLAACRDFLSSRQDSGGPLLRHQALSHRLGRMQLSLESARLVLYRAAWLIDEGRDDPAAAAMAKLAASEAVVAAAEDSFRLLAGSGWRGETGDTAGAVIDTLATLLASGTSEILLELLARSRPREAMP